MKSGQLLEQDGVAQHQTVGDGEGSRIRRRRTRSDAGEQDQREGDGEAARWSTASSDIERLRDGEGRKRSLTYTGLEMADNNTI